MVVLALLWACKGFSPTDTGGDTDTDTGADTSAETGDTGFETGETDTDTSDTDTDVVDTGWAGVTRWSGTSDLATTAAVLDGENEHDVAGTGVAAGDLDGDGVPEIVVGAPYRDKKAADAGLVYVLSAPVAPGELFADASATLAGLDASGGAGWSVEVTDFDGDDVGELLIGAPSVDFSGTGAVYVVDEPLGDSSLSGATSKWTGENAGDAFGWTMAAVGDTNGDGVRDVLVGAPRSNSAGLYGGAAYLLTGPGGASGPVVSIAAAKVSGKGNYFRAGGAVGGPGDLDGDGYDDLGVGLGGWLDSSLGYTTGAVAVLYGPVSGAMTESSADAFVRGHSSGDTVGADPGTIAGADTDGDGYSDLVVGYPDEDADGSTVRGGVYVVLGGASRLPLETDVSSAHARIFGVASGDSLGTSVASAGDADRDGYEDLLVGDTADKTNGDGAGSVRLLYGPFSGTQTVTAVPGAAFLGDAGWEVGLSARALGDVTGDGIPDVLAGTPGAAVDTGGAVVFSLGPALLE